MAYTHTRPGARLHPRLAVALRHELGQAGAPRVIASGKGAFAERLIGMAEDHGVPIHKDDGLARLLGDLEDPSTIPVELFEAVARVLAFVYRVDGRLK